MGLLSSIFGKKDKDEKKADFGNVSSGSSSTARELREPTPPPSPTPEPTGTPLGAGTRYEIRKGDTLSAIAERHYGDATEWRRIYEANRDVIEDPDRIYPGETITIPEKT